MSESIGIVCSDRGQHGLTILGDLSWRDGLLRANQSAVYDQRVEKQKAQCIWLDWLDEDLAEYRVHMRCPRCNRHPQWTHDRAMKILLALSEAGQTRMDISHL